MKKSYFGNDKTKKTIRDIYDDTNKIKLTGMGKFTYGLKSIMIPFSMAHLSIGMDMCKSKYKKYEKDGKQLSSATERYKFVDKIIRRTLNTKHVKYHEFGFDHVPKTPVLFICNHKSLIDALLLMHTAIKHDELPFVRVLAKTELQDTRRLSWLLRLMDTIWIDRKDIRSLNKVIDECANVFKEDHSLLIFPEGTRTSGNELGKFSSAILEVAYKTFVPIVPVCIFGTDGFLAKDKSEKPKYHIGEIVIDALEPIRASEYMNWSRQYLADVLHDRIQQRYNLWKENHEYMYSSSFKRYKVDDPLTANKRLNESEQQRIKARGSNSAQKQVNKKTGPTISTNTNSNSKK